MPKFTVESIYTLGDHVVFSMNNILYAGSITAISTHHDTHGKDVVDYTVFYAANQMSKRVKEDYVLGKITDENLCKNIDDFLHIAPCETKLEFAPDKALTDEELAKAKEAITKKLDEIKEKTPEEVKSIGDAIVDLAKSAEKELKGILKMLKGKLGGK